MMNSILLIRNIALGFLGLPKEYKIKYYSPYDQVNSIKEETRWSPQLTLEFPKMDTLDIVLFEIFPMGEDFKSMQNDTTYLKDSMKKTRQVNDDSIKIYPNPNQGAFTILIEKSEKVKFIQILDNLGKQVDLRKTVSRENHYRNSSLKPGVYLIEVIFEDKVIRRKVIIN